MMLIFVVMTKMMIMMLMTLKKDEFNNNRKEYALQTLHVYSTLKRRRNVRFHFVLTWNTREVFVGY